MCGHLDHERLDAVHVSCSHQNLSALEVHERLCEALATMERAEQHAILWFAEVMRRKLHRELGHASLQQYAADALGFSPAKTSQFIRLAGALDHLPALKRALTSGDVPWTKARVIVGVATPETERHWIEEASRGSRRDLEQKIARARGQVRIARRLDRRQRSLEIVNGRTGDRRDLDDPATLPDSNPGSAMDRARSDPDVVVEIDETRGEPAAGGVDGAAAGVDGAAAGVDGAAGGVDGAAAGVDGAAAGVDGAAAGVDGAAAGVDGASGNACVTGAGSRPGVSGGIPGTVEPVGVPVDVHLRFDPEEYARYEALIEAARNQGHRESREALVLAALEREVLAGTETAIGTRGARGWQTADVTQGDAGRDRSHRHARDQTAAEQGAVEQNAAERERAEGLRPIIRNSPYQVVVYQCETCRKAHVVTPRGNKTIDIATLGTILADAYILRKDRARRRSVVSPALRARVFTRDGHRCRAYGCGRTSFLRPHHIIPPELGGTNDLSNMITLCDRCHKFLHSRYWPTRSGRPVPPPVGAPRTDDRIGTVDRAPGDRASRDCAPEDRVPRGRAPSGSAPEGRAPGGRATEDPGPEAPVPSNRDASDDTVGARTRRRTRPP